MRLKFFVLTIFLLTFSCNNNTSGSTASAGSYTYQAKGSQTTWTEPAITSSGSTTYVTDYTGLTSALSSAAAGSIIEIDSNSLTCTAQITL
jgi:hypothetical protein